MLRKKAHSLLKASWKSSSSALKIQTRSFAIFPATSIDHVFPGTPETKPVAHFEEARVSKLANGVTVATHDWPTSSASLSVFVNAGTRFETQSTYGAANFLKYLAPQNNRVQTGFKTTVGLDILTGDHTSEVGREFISFQTKLPRDDQTIVSTVHNLSAILQPKLEEWQIRDSRPVVALRANNFRSCNTMFVCDNLHQAAFRDVGLAAPRVPPDSVIKRISPDILTKYVQENYTGPNTFVVGTGISHEALVEVVSHYFSFLPSTATSRNLGVGYVGGEHRVPVGGGYSYFIIGFKGVSYASPNEASFGVLKAILGGGNKDTNPGEGSGGSLFKIAQQSTCNNIRAVGPTYSDAGYFGVLAHCCQKDTKNVVDSILSTLKATKTVSEADVARAKNAYKASFLRSIEDRYNWATFIAERAHKGVDINVSTYLAQIDKVSRDSVVKLATELLSSSPSLSATGATADLPTLAEIRSKLN